MPPGFQPGAGGGIRQGGQVGQVGQVGQGRLGVPGNGQFQPGQRPGGGRPGQSEQSDENPQEQEYVTGPGTVPEIWDKNPQQDFEIRSLSDRAIISLPLTSKVLRYSEHYITTYDTNTNGRLEFDEWYGKIPYGHVIDLNGDGVITLDEIATYIEKFSNGRTIHNPFPLHQLLENRVIPQQIKPEGIFRPLSPPPVARKIFYSENVEERPVLSDEEMVEGVRSEDDVDESGNTNEPFQGRMPNTLTKIYAAPTQGLPAWFVQRDTNGDGQVSLYEFCAPNFRDEDLAIFGQLDRNGDGFITLDELPLQNAE